MCRCRWPETRPQSDLGLLRRRAAEILLQADLAFVRLSPGSCAQTETRQPCPLRRRVSAMALRDSRQNPVRLPPEVWELILALVPHDRLASTPHGLAMRDWFRANTIDSGSENLEADRIIRLPMQSGRCYRWCATS